MKSTADQYCYVYFCILDEPAMFKLSTTLLQGSCKLIVFMSCEILTRVECVHPLGMLEKTPDCSRIKKAEECMSWQSHNLHVFYSNIVGTFIKYLFCSLKLC